MDQKSNRKPYVRPVEANWWTKKKFYTHYMIREATSVLVLLFTFEMLFYYIKLACMNSLEGFVSVAGYLNGFVAHPIMIVFNILVLAAVLFHAFTWFPLMPKALRIVIKDKKSGLYKILGGKLLIIAMFSAMAIVTLLGACLFFVS